MRHKLWLLSAFTVAATLSLGATDVAAAAQKSAKPPAAKAAKSKQKSAEYDAIGAYAVNTAGCPAPHVPTQKVEDWKNAKLTAQFIKQDDGSYKAHILPGATNEDAHVPIASIAKFMTALVIFDLVDQKKIDLSRPIRVTKESLCLGDNRFAVIGLPAHITEIIGDHAMTQMLRISSNTMAVNLAIAGAGSVDDFVKLMNDKAKSWGMHNTRFLNPHGLPYGDRKGEYTTARDMLIMAEHILVQMERFRKYGTDPMQTWTLGEDPPRDSALKKRLSELGAVFKTATVAKCRSLLTVAEQGDYKMANIQLCNKDRSAFPNAIASVKDTFKTAFKRLGDMIPSAMANEARPPLGDKERAASAAPSVTSMHTSMNTRPVSLSSRPDRSIDP